MRPGDFAKFAGDIGLIDKSAADVLPLVKVTRPYVRDIYKDLSTKSKQAYRAGRKRFSKRRARRILKGLKSTILTKAVRAQ